MTLTDFSKLQTTSFRTLSITQIMVEELIFMSSTIEKTIKLFLLSTTKAKAFKNKTRMPFSKFSVKFQRTRTLRSS